MKLPMNCDDIFHAAFHNDVYYKPIDTHVYCNKCDTRLKVYYAEERLYAVRCCYCESITLVKASNPVEAASYVGKMNIGDELLRQCEQLDIPIDNCIKLEEFYGEEPNDGNV